MDFLLHHGSWFFTRGGNGEEANLSAPRSCCSGSSCCGGRTSGRSNAFPPTCVVVGGRLRLPQCTLSTVLDEVTVAGAKSPLKLRSMASLCTPSSRLTASLTLRRSSLDNSQVLKRALGNSNDCQVKLCQKFLQKQLHCVVKWRSLLGICSASRLHGWYF
ncbi:hypothetical protein V5799_014237 [Amblyomma americanum]|uniref:Uncharacterized protein n=1 Tax=Amblyomma americanum TaxID=6943 RepID=A0AAQ4E3M8_AMBAM